MLGKARKNKIAIVFHSANLQSGATKSLMDIVDNLIKLNKYDFVGIFPEEGGTAVQHLREQGIETYAYHYGDLMQDLTQSWIKRTIKFPFLILRHLRVLQQVQKAKNELKGKGIDLVYANTSSIVFGGYLSDVLGCKNIWHIREFRVKDHRIKFYLGERWIKKFINKRAKRVMYVSHAVMMENVDVISEKKSVVTYNSYSSNFVDPKDQFNREDKLSVMLAGDIKESKGQLVVIKALHEISTSHPDYDIELFLAGRESNKEYYQKVNKYIKDNGLQKKVHLLGQVGDMKTLRKTMDVGIVASTCEAFGRTTIEGMLSCLAMIGRDSGGTTEQIKDGDTGLLYDGSVDALAKCICRLYENRDELEQLAKNGFKEAVELHTKGRCYKLVEEAIDEVLEE